MMFFNLGTWGNSNLISLGYLGKEPHPKTAVRRYSPTREPEMEEKMDSMGGTDCKTNVPALPKDKFDPS